MRRLTLGVLVAALLLIATSIQPAVAYKDYRDNHCRFQSLTKEKWSKREVHLTIHCALKHFPSSHYMADLVASHESGMRHAAVNRSSGACGVYQHIPSYWPIRQNGFDNARPRWNISENCKNARANVLVSVRIAHISGWEGNWCRWTTYC